MAQAKTARIVEARLLGPATRLLTLEFGPELGSLGFVGGQYLIVNSGVVLPGGKLAKRAYSILSADERQECVQLAVKRIDNGAGSSFLHAAAVGASFEFSGPWGKYLPDDSRPRPTWLIATDTGITAALGLVRGGKFAPQRASTSLVWLVQSADYFLPEPFVHEAASGVTVQIERIPPVGHPERLAVAQSVLDRLLRRGRPESVFLSGDGAVLYPLRDRLGTAGISPDQVRLESFFNNPERRAT
jgi:ferredoxin-NADP reductase